MADLSPGALSKVIGGDLDTFSLLLQSTHKQIQTAAAVLPELILTPTAVRRVLNALLNKEVAPERVQLWASFVRRGYIGIWEGQPPEEATIPVAPIGIEYEPDAEDAIADVISRLDEIGDLIDGEVTDDEIVRMLASTSQPPDKGHGR